MALPKRKKNFLFRLHLEARVRNYIASYLFFTIEPSYYVVYKSLTLMLFFSDIHTHIYNSLPRPGETAVIRATSARSGVIKCPVNYSKYRCILNINLKQNQRSGLWSFLHSTSFFIYKKLF